MKNSSKLILLINSLEEGELSELNMWLISPLHNQSKRAHDLFKFLRKKVWRIEQPFPLLQAMKKVKIVAPNAKEPSISPKNKQDYRKIASRLTIQIENFLKWKQFQRNEVYSNLLLMNSFLERQLYTLNTSLINKTKLRQEQSPIRDIPYCKNEFALAEMEFFMDIILQNRKITGSMKKVVDNLRISCFTQLLRYYCAVSNFKNLLTYKSDFPFKNVLINYLKDSEDIEDLTVNLYYRLLLLLENGTTEDYFTFKEMLFKSFEAFDNNELRQFFAFMSNYCQQQASEGNALFTRERFTIYQHGLDLGCWTTNIYFSQHQFVEIMKVSLELNKLDWAKQFLDNYKPKLSPQLAQNTILFCQSMLAFHHKEYDLAQEFHSQIESTTDVYLKLKIKVLLLKIYYEGGGLTFEDFDVHPIHNELEALRINTLKGSGIKIAEQTRTKFSNFSHLLKKMLAIKRKQYFRKSDKAAIKQLEAIFQDTKPLTSNEWLGQKLEELKQAGRN